MVLAHSLRMASLTVGYPILVGPGGVYDLLRRYLRRGIGAQHQGRLRRSCICLYPCRAGVEAADIPFTTH